MRVCFAGAAIAVAFSCASASYAGGPPPTGPIGDDPPSQEADYEQDAAAGVSGDGSGTTGIGVNAVPVTPIGSTNFATPGYGTTAGLGGAAQGGSPGNFGALSSVGQVFTASSNGTLNQISFVDTNSAVGGEELHVALFNPVFGLDGISAAPGAVGAQQTIGASEVVSLTNFGDKGGVNGNDALFYHTYSNLGVSLVAGLSYYVYVTPSSGSQVFQGSNSGYASRAYFFELSTQASSLGGYYLGGVGNNYFRVANAAAGTAPYLQAYANISITPSATATVPEPASWAMMVMGFGLVGGAIRRRTARFQVA